MRVTAIREGGEDEHCFSMLHGAFHELRHSLARKLNVTLPQKMTPAKPKLTHAIVVEKLRSVDTTAALNYE